MENLEIYEKVRSVPPEALKTITGGNLKGMSDINPMWRIKALTKVFGPCGVGWWYEVLEKRIENGANDEKCVFVDIALYYEIEGKTSHPVFGTGGSSFVSKTKNGLSTSDECFKMALTDAISVAAKALGVAADVYYSNDKTKYTAATAEGKPEAVSSIKCSGCKQPIKERLINGKPYSVEYIVQNSVELYGEPLCLDCVKKRQNADK